MKKKWSYLIVFAIILIVLVIPKSFYSEDKLIAKLENDFETEEITITNIMKLDHKNYLVHYQKDDRHYSSLWYWNFFYWKNISNTTNTPFEIIQLNRNDPSTIYFTWSNLPADKGSIDLYLKRNTKSYSIVNQSFYYPELLVKQSIELNEPFGAIKLNKDLQVLLNKEDHFYPYSNPELIHSFKFHISLDDPYFKEHMTQPPLASGHRHFSFNKTAFHDIFYTDELYTK